MNVAELFDLTGRKALVTGASRGLGQAIAHALASAGADVAVTARDVNGLEETRTRIGKTGKRSFAYAHDVRDVDSCASVIDAAARALDGLDILVNNAGYEEIRPALDVDEALWERIVSTNLKGAFFCAQAAARNMVALGTGGAIVNLCSLSSYV